MALAHMMCHWAAEQGRHVHLLTVNHNLRDEAGAEGERLYEWVKDFVGSEHHILTWHHDAHKPETAVMEKARQARYTLMADYCQTHQIETLCIAHHADDQVETFLFRLAKGSGLDGLTGMQEWTAYNNHLMLYRPLLAQTHVDLIAYCKTHQLQWIEDPSNSNSAYARPRLRKALQAEGLDAKRFTKTLERLTRAQQALDHIADRCLQSYDMIDWALVKTYPTDIQIRVLQKSLSMIGQTTHTYPPKLERVEEIVNTIKPGHAATLHGCLISLSKDGNTLEIKEG